MITKTALFFLAPLMLATLGTTAMGNDGLDVMRATFRLTDGKVSGTTWIVSVPADGDRKAETVLVSATHVFRDLKGETASLVLRKLSGEKIIRHNFELPLRKEGKKLWTEHQSLDVAAMKIDLPKGIDLLPIEFKQLANEEFVNQEKLVVGQRCLLPCFPAQLESSRAGWPVLRSGTVASHPLKPIAANKTFLLDYTSFGGDSGSPVIAPASNQTGKEHFMVVALITGMHRQTDKTKSPFEERTVHTPLGLGICIQSNFIRDTILKACERNDR